MSKTREQFDQLDVLEQSKFKWRLLQKHFADFVYNIQADDILQDLAGVLHRIDLEQFEKDIQNKANTTVMSSLLLRLPRTCKPWWKPFEKYLLDNGKHKLLSYLDPWRASQDIGASAASPVGCQENSDSTSGCAQPPYSRCTPLGKTKGLVDMLKSCSWGKLAELLGFDLDEQVEIETKTGRDHEIHRCLLAAYVKKCRDNATVGSLVEALLRMGPEGSQIVSAMEEGQLIIHYEREGSEAGEVREEELCGYSINERGDEASARPADVSPWASNLFHRPRCTSADSIHQSLPLNVPSAIEPAAAPEMPVPRSQQGSSRTLNAYGTERRPASSPRATEPPQLKSDRENCVAFSPHQNSEPGRFADSETPPGMIDECDSMHSLSDNASQPVEGVHAGETKLNNAGVEADPAQTWKHEADDQEDGSSLLQTDGPSEISPVSASSGFQLAEGRDVVSSSTAAFLSQPSAISMSPAAELDVGLPSPENVRHNVTINVSFHNSERPVLMIGKTNKFKSRPTSTRTPPFQQMAETGKDRQQEMAMTCHTPLSPLEDDVERSDLSLGLQESQPGSNESPVWSASPGRSLDREKEPFPWERSCHQTDPKEFIQSETEATPRPTSEMYLPSSSDVDLMSHRRLMPEDLQGQTSCHQGDSDHGSAFPRLTGPKFELTDESLCSQRGNAERQEGTNRNNIEDVECENEEATPVAPVGDQEHEKQEHHQQPSGFLRKVSYFLRNFIDSME